LITNHECFVIYAALLLNLNLRMMTSTTLLNTKSLWRENAMMMS